jgi:hypothetical protein
MVLGVIAVVVRHLDEHPGSGHRSARDIRDANRTLENACSHRCAEVGRL